MPVAKSRNDDISLWLDPFLISEWGGVKLGVGGIYEHGCFVISEKRHLVTTYKSRIVPLFASPAKIGRFMIAEKLIPVLDFDPLLRPSLLRNSVILFQTFFFPAHLIGYFLKRFGDTPVFRSCENKKRRKGSAEKMRFRMSRSFSLIFSANKSF